MSPALPYKSLHDRRFARTAPAALIPSVIPLCGVRLDYAPLQLLDWVGRALTFADYAPASHQLLLLERLQEIADGTTDRLMVLMPPGSAKSTYASLIFPAWWLHRHPASAVIAASHTAELAAHFGRGLRNLVDEHQDALGYALARDSRAAHRFRTTRNGQYFATGVNGPVTGRRADLVLIDDPIKNHAEADSAQARDHLWNWYRSELLTRLKPAGRVVLIMTRWHQDDLSGRLLDTGDNWTVLRLPALAEANDPLNRQVGAALWPQWEDETALARKRQAVGSRVWQALYQQDPVVGTGTLFPAKSIVCIDAAPEGLLPVRAWDLAGTEASSGRDPDWTVGLKLARDLAGRIYVLDVLRIRAGPNEVAATLAATAARDGRTVPIGLPQDPGQAGKQQVAWLTSQLAGFRVVASPETGAKLTRATPVAAAAEAGRLHVVRAGWTDAFLDELTSFPHGRKDDQVDALSRAHALLPQPALAARRLSVPVMGR